MRYLLLLGLVGLTGCMASVQVPVGSGIYVKDGKDTNYVGNPRVTCYLPDQRVIDGYFVYQNNDASLVIDTFGKGYAVVEAPVCRVGGKTK